MSEIPVEVVFEPHVYRNVFYSIREPALVIDTNFTIRDANEAAVDMLDYESRQHLIDTPVQSILVNEDVLVEVAEQVATNEEWEGEAKIRTNDNRVFLGRGTAVPIEGTDGEQLIGGLFTDLTKRQQYTRSVKVLNRVLRHNLRNDINVIVGHLEYLRSAVDESERDSIEEMFDRLDDIVEQAKKARTLELLVRNDDTHELSAVDVTDHVERTVAEAQRQYPSADISGPEDVESVTVLGYETLQEVFREVVENAVGHNDSKRPTVRISLTVTDERVVVSVADDGPGIDPDRTDRIFGRAEIDQLHHGSGMGLFFVDQVMRVCGGEVWVEQNEPRGTVVKLQFPRAD